MRPLEALKLIVSLVIIVAVVSFFYTTVTADTPKETDRYGCLSNHAPEGSSLVLVDHTDPYSAGQIKTFRDEVGRIHDTINTGDLLTVASIGGQLPAAVDFRECSPEKGDPNGGLWTSLLHHKDKSSLAVQAEYETAFQVPIQKLAAEMPLNRTEAHSPIIQSIAGVMEQLGPQWGRAQKRHLTIISDLLENTTAFTQYHRDGDQERFADARTEIPYIRDTPLDLKGVTVTVLYLTGLPHHGELQGLDHQRFWRDLIAFYGGDLVDWIVVPNTDVISVE